MDATGEPKIVRLQGCRAPGMLRQSYPDHGVVFVAKRADQL